MGKIKETLMPVSFLKKYEISIFCYSLPTDNGGCWHFNGK